MTYCKLRGAIREKFGTQEAFADAMEMHPATLSGRLTGKSEWSKSEMETAIKLLGVSVHDVHTYFFNR